MVAGKKSVAAVSARSSLAVATLLRLADADLRDAAVLESGRDPRNAPALAERAVVRMIDAVAVTETGWPHPIEDLDPIPDQNPLKRPLAALSGLLPASPPPMPLDDGRAPPIPDRAALREGMIAARALLNELASRFEVDLFGNASAGRVMPVRPEPPPAPPPSPSPTMPRPPVPLREAPRAPAPAKAGPPPRPAKPSPSRTPAAPVTPGSKRHLEPSPRVESPEVEGRSPITLRPGAGSTSSTAFWSLMDRWRVPDIQALELIGHRGGLTRRGTRPRFKLAGDEVEMLHGLQEIDVALKPVKLDPSRWLHEPLEDAPFQGETPLAFLVRMRLAGVREAIRFILQHGLRMSMAT